MTELRVPGRHESDYPIRIGPLALDLNPGTRYACVADPHVWSLHRERIERQAAIDVHFVPRGEDAKCWGELERAIAFLAARGHRRTDPLLALGGGAVGDLAGLVASLYQRGCPVIQLPTTLLAMVDSSVGGKTAIDAEGQKNLVGAFHPPSAVHIDPAFLATLDKRELRAGLAETLKYGLIADPQFYRRLVDDGLAARLIAADPDAAGQAIAVAVRTKADFVRGDLDDRTGRRAILNFGHSFGHAIEAAAGIGALLHGEAVAIGMVMAADFSVAEGYLAATEAQRIRNDLRALGLPVDLAELEGVTPTALFHHMVADKKNDASGINLILLRSIGDAFMARGVDADSLRAFLETY